ncbi:unnamed protein product [Rotaria sordida]|uniref:Uncharacterized protein n=1 Tax=Rotaria sordida TaxID=392033 RepID=A0A813SYH4_9BILA|nr:unnamed protein product [Rotaria sordida]CAF0752492.1 unnamed protein product [Rotaria sordida]CAF0774779.1 unnamed protein product [Rotaria sordida]CAF0801543.1 unnamed protein product [Rotaria sordida]
MSTSLTAVRWYIRTKNFQVCNNLSNQTKEISLSNTQRQCRGNIPIALIATLLIFTIKLPYYIKRYSR